MRKELQELKELLGQEEFEIFMKDMEKSKAKNKKKTIVLGGHK